MKRHRSFSERKFRRNAKNFMRDALLLLSLTGVGSNLVWCWQHTTEIEKLRNQMKATSAKAPESSVTLLR